MSGGFGDGDLVTENVGWRLEVTQYESQASSHYSNDRQVPMRSTIRRGMMAATLAFLGACGSADSLAPRSTLAPASASRTVSANAESVTPIGRAIDQYVWLSCANGGVGEAVRVSGDLHYDFHSKKDSSGVYHLNIKANTSGLTAVGMTTGTFFRGIMNERVNSRADDFMSMDVRTADIIRFTAPGSGASYSLMVSSHFIVDEGNYLLWDQTWNEVCR